MLMDTAACLSWQQLEHSVDEHASIEASPIMATEISGHLITCRSINVLQDTRPEKMNFWAVGDNSEWLLCP